MATRPTTQDTRQPAGGTGPMSGLTPKQEAFVVEYLRDLNATQAALTRPGEHRRAVQTSDVRRRPDRHDLRG